MANKSIILEVLHINPDVKENMRGDRARHGDVAWPFYPTGFLARLSLRRVAHRWLPSLFPFLLASTSVGVILVGEARTKPLRLQPQLEPRLVFLHHQAKLL